MIELNNKDVLEDIKTYEDYFFDIIYSDPPYNLSSEWFIDTDGKYKLKRKAKDFLNKWDGLSEVELDAFFKESYRTLKHGGYLIMYGIDRQLGPFHYYAVKNGFEVCQSLYWFFMSNFPKASDVSKMVDKRFKCEREVVGKKQGDRYKYAFNSDFNPDHPGSFGSGDAATLTTASHPIAKKYEGYKYSIAPLKQVLETVMIFHKPLKGKSYIDDIIACETETDIHSSCLNIEGERVEYKDDDHCLKYDGYSNGKYESDNSNAIFYGNKVQIDTNGRFPSQLLVDENAAKVIDEQTGIKKANPIGKFKSAKDANNRINDDVAYFGSGNRTFCCDDTGGGSKILHQCKYETEEIDLLKYQPKVSKSERNAGLEGFEEHKRTTISKNKRCKKCNHQEVSGSPCKCLEPDWEIIEVQPTQKNNHPTLKPISLNKHILNLFKTPNYTRIYIPFSGSGSELIAAELVGYDEIYGCEISEEYCDIAMARVAHWCNQPKEEPKKKEVDLFKVAEQESIKIEEPEEDDFWS